MLSILVRRAAAPDRLAGILMTPPSSVREHPIEVHCSGRSVPAVLWIPVALTQPAPLVLVGHGGGLHKRAPTVVAMAEGLAREHGLATLAIDGPINGEREPNDPTARELRATDRRAYRRKYYTEKYDEMVEDWRAALAAARAVPEIGDGPVGYWGLSMGTRFGVPLIASEPRIRAAVLGLFGYWSGVSDSRRVYDDAAKIEIPVLFLQQLDDEEVSREAYEQLIAHFGTRDLQLHKNPGKHIGVPRAELIASRQFLADKLKAPDAAV